MPMILSQVSSSLSRKGCIRSQPALLTTMSSWPHCPTRCAIARSTSARRRRSTTSASPLTPSASTSRRTASAFCFTTSSTATWAPSPASASAMARPIPWPPPVTSAVLPLSLTVSLLAVLPDRFPLLDEGAQPLGCVLRGHQLVLVQLLEGGERLVEGDAERLAHRALREPEHDRALGPQPLDLRVDGLAELVRRDDAIDQPDPLSFGRADRLTRAEEVERLREAHARGVVQGRDGRKDADLHLGLAERPRLARDHEIAERRQLGPAPERGALDGREGHAFERAQPAEHLVERLEHRLHPVAQVVLDGDAGRERLALPADHEDLQRRVRRRARERPVDLAHHLDRHDVERRPREREPRHVVLLLEANQLEVIHGSPLRPQILDALGLADGALDRLRLWLRSPCRSPPARPSARRLPSSK